MRIGVRSKCQRLGIGRRIMHYLLAKYPNYLSLDVSTDNDKAIGFYQRIGLDLTETYLSGDKVEFAKFEMPKDFKLFELITTQIVTQSSNNSALPSSLEELKKQEKIEDDSDADTLSTSSVSSKNLEQFLEIKRGGLVKNNKKKKEVTK